MVTTFDEAIEYYSVNAPKGEYVLVVSGASLEEKEAKEAQAFSDMSVTDHVNLLISSGLDKKEAIKQAAKERGMSKRDVYNEFVKDDDNED